MAQMFTLACPAQQRCDYQILGVGGQLSPVPQSNAFQLIWAQTGLNLYISSQCILTCFYEVSSFSGNWNTHQASHTLFPCDQRGPGRPWKPWQHWQVAQYWMKYTIFKDYFISKRAGLQKQKQICRKRAEFGGEFVHLQIKTKTFFIDSIYSILAQRLCCQTILCNGIMGCTSC